MDAMVKQKSHMDLYSVLKRAMLLLSTVLFIFSLSACETIKAAASFKWGKRTECEHHLEAKNAQKEYPSAPEAGPWIMSKK